MTDLASRFFNTPIAIKPDQVGALLAEIRKPEPTPAELKAALAYYHEDDVDDAKADDVVDEIKPYVILESAKGGGPGIAYIPVHGVLMQKTPEWGWYYSSMNFTGYDKIRHCFLTAINDVDVDGILLDVDSPGGEVSGCFDLVDQIYRARGSKPILASLSESAYSAGFAIASAADRVVIPRTGGIGSVGCIMLHLDLSKYLAGAGVTPTIIQYGAKKSDGTDVRPLDKGARTRFQADIDTMGELFVATVARNRKMNSAAVKKTEAGTYLGAAGVGIGFADDVMSPLEAIRALQKQLA